MRSARARFEHEGDTLRGAKAEPLSANVNALAKSAESAHDRTTNILRRLESLGEQLYGNNMASGSMLKGGTDERKDPGVLLRAAEHLSGTHTVLSDIEAKIDDIFENLHLAQPAALAARRAPDYGHDHTD